MDIRKLSKEIGVTGQVRPQDLPEIKALGYRSILCNRPDGEAEDQPLFEEIAAAAADSDLVAEVVPIASSGPTAQDVAAMKALWPELPKPILAYCRSGGRSATLLQSALGNAAQG